MNLKPNVLIFSVFQKSRTLSVNQLAHKQIFKLLEEQGLPVLHLSGRYDGNEELSILVEGFEHRATVERLCKEFNQECYLESHNDRASFLVFPDGSKQSIGTLVAVSESEAETLGSYSYNPVVDQYYVTR